MNHFAEGITDYVFDLYGTLIDAPCDEWAPKTWKRWLRTLDGMGLKHPPYYAVRRDFFALDRQHRIIQKTASGCDVPEIDIIPVYRELLASYGNGILEDETLNTLDYDFRCASRAYIRLYPGAAEFLARLRGSGIGVYILSNAQRAYTWPEIQLLGLDSLTDGQIISSDHGYMKPDRRLFDILIDRYHLTPEQTVMVGDSEYSDIQGAAAVGMKSIHLTGENSADRFYRDRI